MIQEPSIAPIRISELSKGHAGAQFNLGFRYDNGFGVPQDDAEAMRWFRLAADQGQASAQHNLGIMYGTGRGVPQDHIEAHMWFNLAASRSTGDVGDRFVSIRDFAADHMDPTQLAEAQRLAREWDAAQAREP